MSISIYDDFLKPQENQVLLENLYNSISFLIVKIPLALLVAAFITGMFKLIKIIVIT
ncbi:MAG: hypothetical protein ACRCR9_06240 [Chitinophagaceae bacterium]